MQAWHTPEGYDVGYPSQRRKLEGMCHYKHLKPTGEGLHSHAACRGKANRLYRGRDRQGQLQRLPQAQEEWPARAL